MKRVLCWNYITERLGIRIKAKTRAAFWLWITLLASTLLVIINLPAK